MPKKSFLSEYSCIPPRKLRACWPMARTGLRRPLTGQSLNLDFHSVPYFAEHPSSIHYWQAKSRQPASWSSWLRMLMPKCSVRQRDIRKVEEATRSSASSTSGSASTARRRNTCVRLQTHHYAGSTADAAGITFLTLRRRAQAARRSRQPASAAGAPSNSTYPSQYRNPRFYEQKARPLERAYANSSS